MMAEQQTLLENTLLDLVQQIQKENKIMREALDKIISLSGMGLTGISETIAFKDCGNIAREALEKAKRE